MKITVTITGIDFVKDLVTNIMESIEFEPEVEEIHKRGFRDFGNALISTLEKLQNDDTRKTYHEM